MICAHDDSVLAVGKAWSAQPMPVASSNCLARLSAVSRSASNGDAVRSRIAARRFDLVVSVLSSSRWTCEQRTEVGGELFGVG